MSVGVSATTGPAHEAVPTASGRTVKSATRQYFRSIANVAASRQGAQKDFEAVSAAASKMLTWRNGRVTVVTIGATGGFVFEYHDDGTTQQQQQQHFDSSSAGKPFKRNLSSAGDNIFGLDESSAPNTPNGQGRAAKQVPSSQGFETPLSKQQHTQFQEGLPKAPSSARVKYGSRGLNDKVPPKKRFF